MSEYEGVEFDNLIMNMRNSGYSCDSLWNCWIGLVQSSLYLRDSLYIPQGRTFDIVDAFLDCTRRQISNLSPLPELYLEQAHQFMKYSSDERSPECEQYYVELSGQTYNPSYDNFVSLTQNWADSIWEGFYECVTNFDPNVPPAAEEDPFVFAQTMTNTCESYCEKKKAGFIDAIIRAFHEDQQYVENNPEPDSTALYPYPGDQYELVFDTNTNSYQFNDLLPLPGGTPLISWSEINCMANSMVAKCKEGCTITPVFDQQDNLLRVGDSLELIAYQNSFLSTYEVDVGCISDGGDNWETIPFIDGSINCEWSKVYGGSEDDVLLKVLSTSDGGYLLIGFTESDDGDLLGNLSSEQVGWLVKTDHQGNIQWSRTYKATNSGINDNDRLVEAVELSNGDFIVGGVAKHPLNLSGVYSKFWLLKITAQGNVIFDRTYQLQSPTISYFLTNINLDHNGSDIILSGTEQALTAGWYFLRLDATGNVLFEKEYGGDDNDRLFNVILSDNNTYIGVGYEKENGLTSAAISIVRFDTNFNPIWIKRFDGSGFDTGTRVTRLRNGNYLVSAGWPSLSGSLLGNTRGGGYDIAIIELDPNGNQVWSKLYGGTGDDFARAPLELNNGNYLITGFVESNDVDIHGNSGGRDAWLAEINTQGDTIWTKTLGENLDEVISTTIELNNNCYLLGGYSESPSIHPSHHGMNDFWLTKSVPGGCCSHQGFCVRTVSPSTLSIPDSAPEILPISCESAAAKDIKNVLDQLVYEYIEGKVNELEEDYTSTCVNPDNIDDNFTLSYKLGYHHYTLYYYNRAGNLIRTVPPQGVDLLNVDDPNDPSDAFTLNRNTAPAHRFVTDYEYNSLGQLVKQHTPDGGITHFYYNDLGQLRFSQNAKQLANEVYSYTKYDELGRIIQVGESSQAAVGGGFTNNVNVNVFPDIATNNTQITFTVYTQTDPSISYLDGSKQRFLLNRISLSFTDADGDFTTDFDQTATYYSYDPHGNVEWLIQDLPGFLDQQYIRYEYDLVSGNVLKVCYNEGRPDQFFHRYQYDADNRITLAETSTNNISWEKDAAYEYYIHGPLKRTVLGEDHIQGLDYVYTIHGWLKALNHASLDENLDPGKDGLNGTSNFAKDVFAMQLGYFTGDFNRSNSPFNSDDASALNPDPNRSLYNGNISTWTTNNLQHPLASNAEYPGLTGYQYRYDELNRIRTADFKENQDGSGFNAVSDYASSYRYDANGNLYNLNRNGNTTSGLSMDNLSYFYYDQSGGIYDEHSSVPASPTNKLAYVTDAGGGTYNDDIETQPSGNYDYDEIGNLITDSSEEIEKIEWTVYGKIKKIIRSAGSDKPNLLFLYDASGNRVGKTVYFTNNNPPPPITTWYSRDASGNIMATYESVFNTTPNGFVEDIYLLEHPIYGSSRVGQHQEKILIKRIDRPSMEDPVELPLEEDRLIAENTHMQIGVQQPFTFANALSGNIAVTPKSVGQQELDFTSPSSPQIVSPSASFAYGVQSKNRCVVEDDNSRVIFSAYTVASADSLIINNYTCRVLDSNNNMMSIPLTSPIKSNPRGKSLGIKKPGVNHIYYLITVGTDKKAYYHEIDINTKQVSPNHIIDPVGTNYGYGMALINDENTSVIKLYLRKYNSNNTASLVSVNITESGFDAPIDMSNFASGDLNGRGEIQIAPDGTKLALTNQRQSYGWWGETGEILVYNLDANYDASDSTSYQMGGDLTRLGSFDFSPSAQHIYYSKAEQGDQSIVQLSLATDIHTPVINNIHGEVRRGKDGKMYVAERGQTSLQQIVNPDATFVVNDLPLATNGLELTGGIPLQTYKLRSLFEESLLTRTIRQKKYEINDHLGNVRAVVADVKLSEINGSTGEPENFQPDIVATNNYYAFGSLQPGRHYPGDGAGYRYGFNGMEKDDEVNSSSGTSYDFGARQYDARLGRWLSRDPLEIKYTDLSPYNFAANSPIIFNDPDGQEIVIVGDADFVTRVNAFLEKIRATDVGSVVINTLDNHHERVVIREIYKTKDSGFEETTNELKLGSVLFADNIEGGSTDEFLTLAHEIYHAFSDLTNSNGIFKNSITSIQQLEYTAVYFANYIRSVYGYDKFRLKYSGKGLTTFGNGSIFKSTSESFFNPHYEKITGFKVEPEQFKPIPSPEGDGGTLDQLGTKDLPKFRSVVPETVTFTKSKINPKTKQRSSRKEKKKTKRRKRRTPRIAIF